MIVHSTLIRRRGTCRRRRDLFATATMLALNRRMNGIRPGPWIRQVKFFLFDLDGVVYRGAEPISSTITFLARLAERRIPYAFLTDHAGRVPTRIVGKLESMGVELSTDRVITSAMTAAHGLARIKTARVMALGSGDLPGILRKEGVKVVRNDPSHVLLGYIAHAHNHRLAEMAYWLSRGAELWATNRDLTAPGKPFAVLECGAFAALLERVSGQRCRYFGKPGREIFEFALNRFGFLPSETVMIGDRIDTDIAGARAANLHSVLTLTGHTTTYPTDDALMPDCVVDSLLELVAMI